MTHDDDTPLPLPDDCPYALTAVRCGVATRGVWVDAVLTHSGVPVVRVIQHGDGGCDLLTPVEPGAWDAVDAYREYAALWGLGHGIVFEPADALTCELLTRWADGAADPATAPRE